MRALIVGGTGFTGTNVAREASARGIEVVSVSRGAPDSPLEGVDYRMADAATAGELVPGSDVVVATISPRAGSEGTLVGSYSALGRAAAVAGSRLIVIGGFSSLRPAPGEPHIFESGNATPAFAAEAAEMNEVRLWLEQHAPKELDWLFVSPAHKYGPHLPQPEPHGEYRVSHDVALYDEHGHSAIGGADFALAIVDEIATPRHHRTQVHFAY